MTNKIAFIRDRGVGNSINQVIKSRNITRKLFQDISKMVGDDCKNILSQHPINTFDKQIGEIIEKGGENSVLFFDFDSNVEIQPVSKKDIELSPVELLKVKREKSWQEIEDYINGLVNRGDVFREEESIDSNGVSIEIRGINEEEGSIDKIFKMIILNFLTNYTDEFFQNTPVNFEEVFKKKDSLILILFLFSNKGREELKKIGVTINDYDKTIFIEDKFFKTKDKAINKIIRSIYNIVTGNRCTGTLDNVKRLNSLNRIFYNFGYRIKHNINGLEDDFEAKRLDYGKILSVLVGERFVDKVFTSKLKKALSIIPTRNQIHQKYDEKVNDKKSDVIALISDGLKVFFAQVKKYLENNSETDKNPDQLFNKFLEDLPLDSGSMTNISNIISKLFQIIVYTYKVVPRSMMTIDNITNINTAGVYLFMNAESIGITIQDDNTIKLEDKFFDEYNDKVVLKLLAGFVGIKISPYRKVSNKQKAIIMKYLFNIIGYNVTDNKGICKDIEIDKDKIRVYTMKLFLLILFELQEDERFSEIVKILEEYDSDRYFSGDFSGKLNKIETQDYNELFVQDFSGKLGILAIYVTDEEIINKFKEYFRESSDTNLNEEICLKKLNEEIKILRDLYNGKDLTLDDFRQEYHRILQIYNLQNNNGLLNITDLGDFKIALYKFLLNSGIIKVNPEWENRCVDYFKVKLRTFAEKFDKFIKKLLVKDEGVDDLHYHGENGDGGLKGVLTTSYSRYLSFIKKECEADNSFECLEKIFYPKREDISLTGNNKGDIKRIIDGLKFGDKTFFQVWDELFSKFGNIKGKFGEVTKFYQSDVKSEQQQLEQELNEIIRQYNFIKCIGV
ncbi:MAG: hypothetical protein PHE25_02115 [Candidatus Gracilibacteria bacterium]|nr:hypothetical protein [Candidatus Gracilibacteria bacterium]